MDQNLTKRSNILFRGDTWKIVEDIADRGNGKPSQLVRYAVYTFLDRYYSDAEFRRYTKAHFSGITRSRDTLYVSENETYEKRMQGVLDLEGAFEA